MVWQVQCKNEEKYKEDINTQKPMSNQSDPSPIL